MEKARIQQLHEESAQNYRLSEEVAAALLKSEQKSIKKAKSYFGRLMNYILEFVTKIVFHIVNVCQTKICQSTMCIININQNRS